MLKVNHFNWIHEGDPDANVHRMPPWNSKKNFPTLMTKKRVRFNPDYFCPFTSQHRFEPTQPPPTQKENTWHFVSPVFGYSKSFLTKQTNPTKKKTSNNHLSNKNPPNPQNAR